ncbi:phytoene desaturase family protein [Candidatus Uhrbacteria bacterium]|nr:phytoene desaturase family protein [Candidatus Uhrbacteria bacterium]
MRKTIAIVGAGPGGLATALLLAHRGHDVRIFEAKDVPGGRNACIETDGFRFDVGPTFLMMSFILEEIFRETGRELSAYADLMPLSPMYRLHFADKAVDIFEDHDETKASLAASFPGEERGFDRFFASEGERYGRIKDVLLRDNTRYLDALRPTFLRMLPRLAIGRNVFSVLGDYFKDERARLLFTFQSKYLGMSPWDCPGAFGIIPYVEHAFGIRHVRGGLSNLVAALVKACEEEGVRFSYGTRVSRVETQGRRAVGVMLEDGTSVRADDVVVNADFARAMETLFAPGTLRKYAPERLAKKRYSCSVFMMYLGIKGTYGHLPFHNVVFAKDYRKNVEDVFGGRMPSDDMSLYVRSSGGVDDSLAPEGCSTLYVLVPVPNRLLADVDWNDEAPRMRARTMKALSGRLGLGDLEGRIMTERILTPEDFDRDFNVYAGATFNLAHDLRQMLWFRPHNRLEGFENCYLVGGGTHPGSGLPTIYQSGRIAADLIDDGRRSS